MQQRAAGGGREKSLECKPVQSGRWEAGFFAYAKEAASEGPEVPTEQNPRVLASANGGKLVPCETALAAAGATAKVPRAWVAGAAQRGSLAEVRFA